MLNQPVYIGDAQGEGHHITLTLFDTGALVIASFNPDTGNRGQIVMQPDQWRAAMKMLVDSYGIAACPYYDGHQACQAPE
ncbi:hypothetical protein SZ64_09665 [Erythrobacter sp. SG61-1L]|uniref:hypothetical protein n=1 Tax=Erythrobacter sp. SG61-1L TaxID=1603897 RepID=UPI0006C8F287|nr:hypothetical protein [Erythrobacter sp. SG61-1L]KPL68362.1 hypothetical protein SZ64_09665 [Erythrobacter sp. SG61-1L]